MNSMKIRNVKEEYKHFLVTYLLPLIGISYNNNLMPIPEVQGELPKASSSYIRCTNDRIFFSTHDVDMFYLEWNHGLSGDSIAFAREVISAFFGVSTYSRPKNLKAAKIRYSEDFIREANYRLAIQKGICDWCAGKKNEKLYALIQALEHWSVQTYEGNKVTFGFIYNPEAKSPLRNDDYGDWLKFLNDDYSAAFSDCIHSVIEIDENCNLSRHLSITETGIIEKYRLSARLPYRFARIIEKYVTGSCVGIFLLKNGDILISKNRAVQLIKRNLRWLNLSYDTFLNMVRSRPETADISEDLIEQIYASVLDVSFAHTGGIIAVIPDISRLISGQDPVLNICDNLLDNRDLRAMEMEMRKSNVYTGLSPAEINKELSKRLLKRKMVKYLVAERAFPAIDRKLRAELISMDGACILDYTGRVCAVGAIIRNDSGSSGGGRNAAAKKLSKYKGLAVKVSTDGYIELFIQGERVYEIK